MKLIVVGSSPQSNIYLNSQYVSGYHAEIILLDNGDIFLCDKNSSNGTFLNGSKISPGVEVLVPRGSNVVFADTPLDWSRVPDIRMDKQAKKIISIGSHPRNQIHVAGDKVSRFHATIKQNTDGKWYIMDHSTNGTMINNIRIPKETPVKIKGKDDIKCAGIPVPNPVPVKSNWWKYTIAAVLACLVVVGAALLLKNGIQGPKDGDRLYTEYSHSTVLIYMGYHYKITAGSLDLKDAFGSDEFIVKDNRLQPFSGNSQESFATGFYISQDGLIATNLHVARPWLFDRNVQPVEDLVRVWLNNLSKTSNSNYANYISQVHVEGVVDFMYAIPHGQYFDGHNSMSCIEVNSSKDTEIDVAILRAMLPGNKLQEGTISINIRSIPDKKNYKPGTKLATIGFPMATALQDVQKKTLEAIYAEGTMSASNNEYDFGHTATSTNGASGSPVFNNKGQLIGLISSGYGNGYNFAVRAEYIKKLLDEKGIEY